MAKRTARELDLYVDEVWNKGNVELVRDICADPMIRHEADKMIQLSHDQQVERLQRTLGTHRPRFTSEFTVVDDQHAVTVWNMDSNSEKFPKMSGIEVFRIRDGRLTECWNHPHVFGHWG